MGKFCLEWMLIYSLISAFNSVENCRRSFSFSWKNSVSCLLVWGKYDRILLNFSSGKCLILIRVFCFLMIWKVMEANAGSVLDAPVVAQLETSRDVSEAESVNQSVEELFIKVDQVQLLWDSYKFDCVVFFFLFHSVFFSDVHRISVVLLIRFVRVTLTSCCGLVLFMSQSEFQILNEHWILWLTFCAFTVLN